MLLCAHQGRGLDSNLFSDNNSTAGDMQDLQYSAKFTLSKTVSGSTLFVEFAERLRLNSRRRRVAVVLAQRQRCCHVISLLLHILSNVPAAA